MSEPTACSRTGKGHFHAGFTPAYQIATQFSTVANTPTGAVIMATSSDFRMTLTPEQKEQVRKATGKEAEAIELSVEELEERIAPVVPRPRSY
jgi:hypothetical protein